MPEFIFRQDTEWMFFQHWLGSCEYPISFISSDMVAFHKRYVFNHDTLTIN